MNGLFYLSIEPHDKLPVSDGMTFDSITNTPSLISAIMRTDKELSKLSIVALRNLFFVETRAFLVALDAEMAEGLHKRRERIRAIDIAIEEKRVGPNKIALFKQEHE